MRKKKEQTAWRSFKSSETMEKIPINLGDAMFIVRQVRERFPYRHFNPEVQFIYKVARMADLEMPISQEDVSVYIKAVTT